MLSRDWAMVQRFKMIHHQLARPATCSVHYILGIHKDFPSQIEACSACRQDGDIGPQPMQAVTYCWSKQSVASHIDTRFARQFQQVAVTMLHESPDPSLPMYTEDWGNVTAETPQLTLMTAQRLSIEAPLAKVLRVTWHAEHRDPSLTQKALTDAIQVIEVSALAMGNKRMRNPFKHGL